MKTLITIAVLALTSNCAIAQIADDCLDMVKLRDRNVSLDVALGKIDTGINITITQNGNFTPQFMTILLFESLVCRLNQVLVAQGQAPIARELIDAWVNELNSAYSSFDEATDGKVPGTIKPNFNRAREAVMGPWGPTGAKTAAYQSKLPVNVSKAFLAAVPAIDLTTSVSGTTYFKTIIKQGFNVKYESVISQGEALVGNQLWALQNMRKSFGTYAQGTTPSATMLREITNGIVFSSSQITDKRSAALLELQMRLDAEAKAREAVQSTASFKITELENRVTEIEKKLKGN